MPRPPAPTCKHEGHELVPDVLVRHLQPFAAAAAALPLLLLLMAQHEGQQAAISRLDASAAPLLQQVEVGEGSMSC
jgi:hypothetical protein